MITHKQLSLADIFTDCQNKFDNDKYEFLSILDETINLDEIVPVSFVSHFHAATGRPRRHLLYPMLKALLLQLIFSIPTTSLLIVFLKYSQELRDFCGFDVVPDASKFTRFKQDFLSDLQSMFDHLVDLTEPVCHCIDTQKASMLLFDTSAIEAWVTYITCFVFHACRNHFNDIPQLQPHIAFYLFPIKPCASCTIPYLAFFTIITSHMPQIWFRTCFSQYSLFHFSTSYFKIPFANFLFL